MNTRNILGKRAKVLRRAGLILANLYGRGIPSQALQVEAGLLRQVLAQSGRHSLLSLIIDGQPPQLALVKTMQRDPRTRSLLHVDFHAVKMTEKIRVRVPLALVGEAPAVRAQGGIVVQSLNALEVECLPGDLLPRLEVDLGVLSEVGQALFVRDLALPPGWALLADPDQVVVKIAAPAIVEAEAPKVAEVAAAATEEAEAEA